MECSPTLPSKLDSPGNDLAGLLTYTSNELEHLPTGFARSGWNLSCSVLGAYSYGVVTDFHRLPEHQMVWTIGFDPIKVKPSFSTALIVRNPLVPKIDPLAISRAD